MELTNQPTVLLLDLPPSALCGIDLLSFTTSSRFKGIKGIPPGWHIIYVGTSASFSIRQAIWFNIEPQGDVAADIVIERWDPAREQLFPENDEVQRMRTRANLSAIWNEALTPYRQSAATSNTDAHVTEDGISRWMNLTDCITSSLLSRITGGQKNHWSLTSASSAQEDIEDIPGVSGQEITGVRETELKFLPIDLKRTWRAGAVGRERTNAAKDRSWALGDLLQNHCSTHGYQDIIGEMQFTFLMVLTINNFSCLEQWKRIINLCLTCEAAVKDFPQLFVRILTVLRLQLQRCNDAEGGLFDLSDEGGTLLKKLLRGFKRFLYDEMDGTDGYEIKESLEDLEAFVQGEWGWELNDSYLRRGLLQLEDGEQVELEVEDLEAEDERGEYAPVIVDLGAST